MLSHGLSIVIPTYNRRDMLPAAVGSALGWLDRAGSGELVIVDDGSTDGTQGMVHERWRRELGTSRVRFHQHGRNAGVTAAKNSGARLARGDWVVFLDSDDLLIEEAVDAVCAELARSADAPTVFFRCLERSSGDLLGEPVDRPLAVELPQLVSNWRWGECLPVVRADAIRRFPYEAELRGYEGLAYARMAREIGPMIVSPVVARIYDTGDHDRVTAVGRLERSGRQEKYTSLMLREFSSALSLRARLIYLASNLRARFESLVARLVLPRA